MDHFALVILWVFGFGLSLWLYVYRMICLRCFGYQSPNFSNLTMLGLQQLDDNMSGLSQGGSAVERGCAGQR